ncbi:MAG: LPS export ABC transporter permease LptF [Kiloniellales bacterium]
MQAITRYIFNQLLAAAFFITLGLTLAIWLSQSLRWIGYIVNRGLPASTFLYFIGLLLPSFLSVILPLATFCATLFIYHKLVMDSELVVLRATGLSQLQLARPAMILTGFMVLAVYSITLYFLPASYHAFKELQNDIRSDYSTVLLQEGVFNTVSEGITVYVRERSSGGELRGILVHDTRDAARPVTMMAERGALVRSEQGPRVVMVNGNRQQVERGGGRLSLLYFDRYTVELSQLQGSIGARWREPRERYLAELLYPSDDPADRRRYNKLIAEGHQRLVAPLYVLAFVMIALAALLSGELNRRGQFRRVLAALLCVAALESLSLALHDLATRSLTVVPAMYAAAVLPSLVAMAVLLYRPRRSAALRGSAQAAAP